MAACAATLSLMHTLDLIKNHPSPPISFDKQQLLSLTELVTFLQEFLEGYVSPFSYSDEADPLELRIADAAYGAEDMIESYIVDNIHLAAPKANAITKAIAVAKAIAKAELDVDSIKLAAAAAAVAPDVGGQIRYINFYEGLQKVIEEMDMIKKETVAREMDRDKSGLEAELQQRNVSGDDKSSSIESKSEMVGFDDVRLQLLDRLTGGDSNRQIIPIVGMGGIGKTTLARNVFGDQLIKEHFDICLWATISQDYNIEQTLKEVMSRGSRGSSDENVEKLGEELHKYLYGRRYLIVMDDMWSIEVWDKMKFFLPDCSEGSRIIVTTRMSNLAADLTNSSNSIRMSFLNEVDSWILFSKTVFGSEGSVPHLQLQLQLRKIGEKIVAKCKGLPLSIAVIGGLLAKSEHTQGYWEYIEKNLTSIVNLENEEYCLRVLKLSYNHLPCHLKPCFLYLGVFGEDREIEVSTIINLWVSEGFVKSKKNKKLETLGREYFQELVGRNLILALADDEATPRSFLRDRELGSVGMTKLFKVHDLVRDLSLREARKNRLYYVYSKHNPSSRHRRIVMPGSKNINRYYNDISLEDSPYPRSYVLCHYDNFWIFPYFGLLRILHADDPQSMTQVFFQSDVLRFVNLRLLAIRLNDDRERVLRSSISRLWSLHTLIIESEKTLKRTS